MRAVAAITGGREDYTMACLRLGLEPNLGVRRKFARRTAMASQHTDLFTRLESLGKPGVARSGGSRPAGPGATCNRLFLTSHGC